VSFPGQTLLKKDWLVYLFLFLAALAVRLPLVDVHPPGLWYDEAVDALDGLSVLGNAGKYPGKLENAGWPVFFDTEEHPREPMFMYLLGFVFLFVKPTVFSLRGVSAVCGALGVPALYGLVLSATKNRRLALFAALSLLTMRWQIHHSRIGLRVILFTLWLTLSFWAVFAAIEKQRIKNFIKAGIIFGLGFYTHLSFRFAPLILVVMGIILFNQGALQWKKDRAKILVFVLTSLLVFLPLGMDYIRHPFHFSGRLKEVGLFENGFASGLGHIFRNVISTLLMFSFRGDNNPFLNIPGYPVFTPLASVFFYLGIAICVMRIMRKKDVLFPATLFAWMGFMLVGTILSSEAPHFSRSLGASIPAAIFVGYGLAEALEWFTDFFRIQRAVFLIIIIWLGISIWDLSLYFGLYRGNPQLWHRTNAAWVEVARTIAYLTQEDLIVYLPGDIYRHASVRYLTLDVPGEQLRNTRFPECISGGAGSKDRDHVILATIYNKLDGLLKKEIPSGRYIQSFRTPEGYVWAVFYRISKTDLLPLNRAEEVFKQYSPETER
jgi:4-amino-4-deoxy-L-arabinose transferase-like glycosyltransferase